MPKQLFTAATCEKCGGALNLSTLQCEYCHVPHIFDLSKAIPYPAAELPDNQYFRLRDRRTDALLLSLIQPAFVTANIEPVLSLEDEDGLRSTMTVMAKIPFDDRLIVVAKITSFATNQNLCRIKYHFPQEYVVDVRWEVDIIHGGRIYFLDDWLSNNRPLGVEHQLACSDQLAGVIAEMTDTAVKCDIALRQKAEEKTRAAQKPTGFLAKIFGVG